MNKFESKNGAVIAWGSIGKIEVKEVGEKKTKVANFSVFLGKNEETNANEYLNCQSFSEDVQNIVSTIKEHSTVLVVGEKNTRTGNDGKEYTRYTISILLPMNELTQLILNMANQKNEQKEDKKVLPKVNTVTLDTVDDEDLPF